MGCEQILPPHRDGSPLDAPLELAQLPSSREWEGQIAYLDRDGVLNVGSEEYVNAPGEERFLEVERRLAERPTVDVPAIVLRGLDSGFGRPSADSTGDEGRFSRLVTRRLVAGAGHDLPVQRPDEVVNALLELLA